MGIDLSKSDLSENQKDKLLTLLGQYRQHSDKDLSEIRCTKVGRNVIDTGDARPIRQYPYRSAPKTKGELDMILDNMEERRIIQNSKSSWSSHILLLTKENGEKRFVVDYRNFNAVTKIFTLQLPHLSDVSDTLGSSKAQVMSVCDIKKSFWKIEIDEASKENTTCITHRDQYEFNRLRR